MIRFYSSDVDIFRRIAVNEALVRNIGPLSYDSGWNVIISREAKFNFKDIDLPISFACFVFYANHCEYTLV